MELWKLPLKLPDTEFVTIFWFQPVTNMPSVILFSKIPRSIQTPETRSGGWRAASGLANEYSFSLCPLLLKIVENILELFSARIFPTGFSGPTHPLHMFVYYVVCKPSILPLPYHKSLPQLGSAAGKQMPDYKELWLKDNNTNLRCQLRPQLLPL